MSIFKPTTSLQVGCGAIGCEMLKNFALLGVGLASSSGEVGDLSFCVSSPLFLQDISVTRRVCPFSGVHHRPRPYRKVQPQSSVSLQTASYTGEQMSSTLLTSYL